MQKVLPMVDQAVEIAGRRMLGPRDSASLKLLKIGLQNYHQYPHS